VTRRTPDRPDVDRLLREALADDLPPDVEGRLRTAMRSSWRPAGASVEEAPGARWARGENGSAWGWRPLRPVLAAAAVLMLAVGWVVHLEADAGPRAESFLAQQISARVVAQLHRVSAMSCRLETRDAQGRAVRFAIDWQDTGEAEVRIEGPRATRHRRVDVPRETTSVLMLTRAPFAPEASRPDDPDLSPAAAHLSPERLASLLAGRWERIPDAPGAPPGVATFSVSTPERPLAVRVTVDTETFLPLSVEETGTRAGFVWPPAPPSPRLLGDHPRSAERPAASWS